MSCQLEQGKNCHAHSCMLITRLAFTCKSETALGEAFACQLSGGVTVEMGTTPWLCFLPVLWGG